MQDYLSTLLQHGHVKSWAWLRGVGVHRPSWLPCALLASPFSCGPAAVRLCVCHFLKITCLHNENFFPASEVSFNQLRERIPTAGVKRMLRCLMPLHLVMVICWEAHLFVSVCAKFHIISSHIFFSSFLLKTRFWASWFGRCVGKNTDYISICSKDLFAPGFADVEPEPEVHYTQSIYQKNNPQNLAHVFVVW